jgi:hypothetical protein
MLTKTRINRPDWNRSRRWRILAMRFVIAIHLTLTPALLLGQAPDHKSVDALIKNLASTSFQDRQAATQALLRRPEAVPKLRDLLRSADLEVARRAAFILGHFDGLPLRELNSTVKEGRVDRAIQLLASWPKGKDDDEVYSAVRQLARTLIELHRKQGGGALQQLRWLDITAHDLVNEQRITENTRAPKNPRALEKLLFLRAEEVDLDYSRRKRSSGPPDIECVGCDRHLCLRANP